MLLPIFLTRDEERVPLENPCDWQGSVLKPSGLLCLPWTLAVGSIRRKPGKPKHKNNTGHYYWTECFLHAGFDLLLSPLFVCLNRYSIFPLFLFSCCLICFYLWLSFCVPVMLDFGLDSDFLWLSLSYNVSH